MPRKQHRIPLPGRHGALRAGVAVLLLLGAGAGVWFFLWWRGGSFARTGEHRVVLLGFSGADAKLVEQYLAQGALPNLERLRRQGGYRRLATVFPTQAASTWASLLTGEALDRHGVFEYVASATDPPYAPRLESMSRLEHGRYLWDLIPTQRKRFLGQRPPRDLLTDAAQDGLATVALFPVGHFPVEKTANLRVLAGPGVPDLRGEAGRYSLLTTDADEVEGGAKRGGDWNLLKLGEDEDELAGLMFDGYVRGPRHAAEAERLLALERERQTIHDDADAGRLIRTAAIARLRRLDRREQEILDNLEMRIPVRVMRAPDAVRLELAGATYLVDRHTWSPWCAVSFSLTPFKKLHGMVRFYVLDTEPHIRLYATPVEFDPRKPSAPLAHPKRFATRLTREVGPFKTRGDPAESAGFVDGALPHDAFLADLEQVMRQRGELTLAAIRRGDWDLLAAFFPGPEEVGRLFWSGMDRAHPGHDAGRAARANAAVQRIYRVMDDIVGEVFQALDDDSTLMVVSNQGLTGTRRHVHLNTVLQQLGYLEKSPGAVRDWPRLGADVRAAGGEAFHYYTSDGLSHWLVDWASTSAFALGPGGIYLNRGAREAKGIVTSDDAPDLMRDLRRDLLAHVDIEGASVIVAVSPTRDLLPASRLPGAPDLLVTFAPGYGGEYRMLGSLPDLDVEPNTTNWSGGGANVDPQAIPGVLFSTHAQLPAEPSIMEVPGLVRERLGSR